MRAAPLGAYFASDPDELIAAKARASAEITHSHAEGIAGAIAVSIAAAVAWRNKSAGSASFAKILFQSTINAAPAGETRLAIERAATFPFDRESIDAGRELGNGFLVTAPDTVPFAIWCAAKHSDDFVEAMLSAVEAGGDTDTICAIVGGIVALSAGSESIPDD